jgi:hypothetical protein
MNELAERLAGGLRTFTFRYANEIELQDSIETALLKLGYAPEREVRLSARDRIDFMIEGVGLEVKVGSCPANVWRQLERYAEDPRIDALLLATTIARHQFYDATMTNGKRLYVVHLLNGAL